MQNSTDSAQHDNDTSKRLRRLVNAAATAAIVVAGILLLAKLVAWALTGSVGVLAALVDSMLDLLASCLIALAIRYASQPPDKDHPFGHGKAESLACLGQAVFIASSALFLAIFSIERLINPEVIVDLNVGVGIIVFSMVLTAALVLFQRYVVKRSGSLAIKSDSLHYSADLISNAGVLLGLALYYWGSLYADPLIALLIAAYIFYSAWEIGREAIQLLLDRALPEEEHAQVLEVALGFPGVIDVHDVRTRKSGTLRFIQLHLVMNGGLTLHEAHELSDRVEAALKVHFGNADVLTHQDPHTELVNKR